MNKWYQTIIVNHKEEEGKLSHWFDDENYKILCEERVEQLKEIERLHSIIKEVREYVEEKTCELNSCFSDGDWHCTTVKKLLKILDKEDNDE